MQKLILVLPEPAAKYAAEKALSRPLALCCTPLHHGSLQAQFGNLDDRCGCVEPLRLDLAAPLLSLWPFRTKCFQDHRLLCVAPENPLDLTFLRHPSSFW